MVLRIEAFLMDFCSQGFNGATQCEDLAMHPRGHPALRLRDTLVCFVGNACSEPSA